jgi:hypothetical protein
MVKQTLKKILYILTYVMPDRRPVFGRKIAHIQGARKFETGVYSCT